MTALHPVKAVVSMAEMRTDRIESPPVRQGVRPEVTPPRAVTPPPQAERARAHAREPLADAQIREVVMRARDEAARPVVRHAPERALQRQRAYLRASRLDDARQPPRSDHNV
jgi:hypothetical protein